MRSKSIYCVYCKKKNNTKDKKCCKCNKKLDPKESLFIDYLKEHIKDDLKGKVEDKIIDIIKNFIISHLYGFILIATLIFTVVSGIITNGEEIKEVTEKPILLNKNSCQFKDSKDLIKACRDGYSLEDDVCVKEKIISADVRYECIEGYSLNSNRCISNESFELIIDKKCIAPNESDVLGAEIIDGECIVKRCAGWTDGVCSAGSNEPIDFTITTYCPSGTSLINGKCKKITNYNITYNCASGELDKDKCIIIKEEDYNLECPDGYNLNEECNLCVLGE